ncbi:hypothetical protein [Psittacicella gerlachiana]|uniref:Uncharacterized protein n=1 Tax=Psittacicella gerlachiana TaxID=2028574 RepID=A0A3A1Y640_9GAMM|nr:hypothetical protein [Psittacicella gerlachiana]RIY31657.1 hypothetical protein CKF59_07480 [Psittacicella gerlachiana]
MKSIPFNLGVLGTPNGFQCASLFPERISKRVIDHLDLILLNKLLPNPKNKQQEFPIYALTSFTENNKVYFGMSQYTSCFQVNGNRSGNFFGSFFISEQILVPEDLNRIFVGLSKISNTLLEKGIVVEDRYTQELDELNLNFIETGLYANLNFAGISYSSAIQSNIDKKLLIILDPLKKIEDIGRNLTELTIALHESRALNLFSTVLLTADEEVVKSIVSDESNYIVIRQNDLKSGAKKEFGNRNLFQFIIDFLETNTEKLVKNEVNKVRDHATKELALQEKNFKIVLEKQKEEFESTLEKYIKDLKVSKEQIVEANKIISNLEKDKKISLEKLEKDLLAAFDKELRIKKGELENLQQQLVAKSKEFDKSKANFEAKINSLVVEFQNRTKLEVERVSNNLRRELDLRTQELNTLKPKYEQLNKNLIETESKYKTFRKECEATLQREFNNTLERVKGEFAKKISDERTVHKVNLDRLLNDQNKLLKAKESENDKLKSEINRLKSEIGNSAQSKESLIKTIKESESKIERQIALEKSLRNEIFAIKKEYEKLVIEKNKLASHNKSLEEFNADEKYKANDFEDKLANANKLKEHLQVQVNSLKASNEILEKELSSKEKELKRLRKIEDELREQLLGASNSREIERSKTVNKEQTQEEQSTKSSITYEEERISGLSTIPVNLYPEVAYVETKPQDFSKYKVVVNSLDWSYLQKVKHSLDKLHNCIFSNQLNGKTLQESLFGNFTKYEQLSVVLNNLERDFLILEALTLQEHLEAFRSDKEARYKYLQLFVYALYSNLSSYINSINLGIFVERDQLNYSQLEEVITASKNGQDINVLCEKLKGLGIDKYISNENIKSLRELRSELIEQVNNTKSDRSAFMVYRGLCALYLLRFIYKVVNLK